MTEKERQRLLTILTKEAKSKPEPKHTLIDGMFRIQARGCTCNGQGTCLYCQVDWRPLLSKSL